MAESKAMEKKGQVALEQMNEAPVVAPPVDIFESKDEYLLVADMPGVDQKSIHVSFERDRLVLDGRLPAVQHGSLVSSEFTPTGYRRSFQVPSGINAEKIGAEYKNGVLTVRLPKSDRLKPRSIAIKSE